MAIGGQDYYYYDVRKGDSLYGIARTMGWNTDTLTSVNRGVDAELQPGRRLYYPIPTAITANSAIPTTESESFFYTVKPGDTLYSLAQRYNTTIESLMRSNPGINDRNFKADTVITIVPNEREQLMRTEQVTARRLTAFDAYTVKKDDSWSSIARRNGVTAAELRGANPGMAELKKGEQINLPIYGDVVETHSYVEADPREQTEEGRYEIFEEVQATLQAERRPEINVCVLMQNPQARKDIDFMRGVLIELGRADLQGSKINLTVADASAEGFRASTDPNVAKADVVISTFDKDTPESVTLFCRDSDKTLINVFDVKNTDWESNRSLIQLLPPTSYFNETVAADMPRRFGHSTFIFFNTPGSDDPESLKNEIVTAVAAKDISFIFLTDASELKSFRFEPGADYVVVADGQKKADAEELIGTLSAATERDPMLSVALIGRPNWVTFADDIAKMTNKVNTFIPSRFYFNNDAADAKTFLSLYSDGFDQTPTRSFPLYAAMGADVVTKLLPSLAHKVSPDTIASTGALQLPIRIVGSDAGGYINTGACMIQIDRMGNITKHTL